MPIIFGTRKNEIFLMGDKMKKLALLAAIIFCIFGVSLASAAQDYPNSTSDRPALVSDEIVVKFDSSVDALRKKSIQDTYGLSLKREGLTSCVNETVLH